MKITLSTGLIILTATLTSCSTTETAATGVGETIGNAAQGVGKTVTTAATGVGNTVTKTVDAAKKGGPLDAAVAAGDGATSTVIDTGKSHMKTSQGVLKDTGNTLNETGEAASNE